MKIALIGYGKMGRSLDRLAQNTGCSVVSRINRQDKISIESLLDAKVCIEFSHPESAFDNICRCAELGKDIVVGTTGWYHLLPEVEKIVQYNNVGLLYAPNFSIGIQLFLSLAEKAASLMREYPEYDLGLIEEHHKEKVDAPSGTAKVLLNVISENWGKKRAESVIINSLRCGEIPGTHKMIFDSSCDTIELTHRARNREGFAHGALKAALWVNEKKGIFTMQDFIQSVGC